MTIGELTGIADFLADSYVRELTVALGRQPVDAKRVRRGELIRSLCEKGDTCKPLAINVNANLLIIPVQQKVHLVSDFFLKLLQHIRRVQLRVIVVAKAEQSHI